jgi:nanoRNase/pAp phosphatase (c-di-AMP/oligoRNAs hydrolase)
MENRNWVVAFMTTCIYHKECLDGFGAAWAAQSVLPQGRKFIEAQYNDKPPALKGEEVYILDFSYPRDVLISIAEEADFVTILDHHKTSANSLVDLPPNVSTVFDQEKSGAELAWEYFHPEEEMPVALRAVADRDIRAGKVPDSTEICAALWSYPRNFTLWNSLMHPAYLPQLVAEGKSIIRANSALMSEMLKVLTKEIKYANLEVAVINVPHAVANGISDRMTPYYDFIVIWSDERAGRRLSFRSKHVNVRELAEFYGGGGHDKAAGAVIRAGQAPEFGL